MIASIGRGLSMHAHRLNVVALVVLLLGSCSKTRLDYWGQPAGPGEELSPGFPEMAAKLYSAVEQERQKLENSDAEFDQFQPTVNQLKDETRKAIHSRVDRDLDYLIEGYSGKLNMLRNFRSLRDGTEYLPVLRHQLDGCRTELDRLFVADPKPGPSSELPLSPCLAPVPRTK
jgi:hypothetical protein